METFLAEVAQRLMTEHPDDLDNVTVVFNNRRSGLFLRRQLASIERRPHFLPKIIGFDELVAELGGFNILPNELLLFELFDIHRHIERGGRKFTTFEEFISFGDMMLADFSEIDLYCVDARQLFSNLHELKAIGEWDVETGELTPFQQRYIEFYKSLYQYYEQLRSRLFAQQKAYNGMAYRHVAENIEHLVPETGGRGYYFVGFNALSTSERTIIRHYTKSGFGKFITDGDAYYVNDKDQEAGHFLRLYQDSDIPVLNDYPDHFAQGHKDITITGCPEGVLQCKYAGKLIADMAQNQQTDEQTAVVLADETLLLPMLNSLPAEIKTANVTMGFPFANTAVHALMLKCFSLHQRRRGAYFYHQDIGSILSDQYICKILGTNDIYHKLERHLHNGHIIYANQEEVASLCKGMNCDPSPILPLFSPSPLTPDQFLLLSKELVHRLHTSEAFENNLKEKEALACLLQTINYFQELQAKHHFVESLSVLLKIYTRIAQRQSVAFYGEPLHGLQILGVLETRNLDFKRIVLLSANEEILPAGKSYNTLIPYNLKKAFNIPTFHEKDAVYAYNFYRLLQRAETIHLLYNTESDGMGKGAPSRFLLQIRRELAKRYPDNITIHEEVVSANTATHDGTAIPTYDKTDAILQRINEIATNGLSPSALNKYRNCPLKFYFENVLRIRETDKVSDDLNQSELGTCIHAILHTIYSKGQGKPLQRAALDQALQNLDQLLHEEFDKNFQHGRSHEGKNYFLAAVAKSQITHFLRSEMHHLDHGDTITILELERPLSHRLDITIDNTPTAVTISGIADRIDLCNGTIRILDYKSGRVEEKDLHVKKTQPNWESVSDKWFQVMLYTWLYGHNKQSDAPHQAGIIPLGRLNAEVFFAEWDGASVMTPSHLTAFEDILKEVVSEILNPNIPFYAKPKNETCAYCPFADTCRFDKQQHAE